MKIGITVEPFKGISIGTLIPFVKAIALDHIEINVNSMCEIDKILNTLGKLTTTFHLPICGVEGYDLGSTRSDAIKKSKGVISYINTYYNELNMLYTLSHPPESPDSTFECLIEHLQQIETPIILENIPLQSDYEFLDFYFKVKDHLGKKLAGHALDGPHRFLTDNENWLTIPKELENEIIFVHLQDTTKTHDAHLPLGEGELPYKDLLNYLKKIGYKGIINQEIKPKGLDLVGIMNSCLNIAKIVSKMKYFKMKTRYAFLQPILKRKISKVTRRKKNEEYE